ncbi:BioY family protein [Neisseriaceae bacterium B1]
MNDKESLHNILLTIISISFIASKVGVFFIAYLALKENVNHASWLLFVAALYMLLISLNTKSKE